MTTAFKPIYPEKKNPYYIVTPRYVRTSAGIRALHLLCHALNSIGETAYVIIHPSYNPEVAVLPDLLTPVLTKQLIDYHYREGLTPIVVYPETVAGNPFRAPCVARYVLNFPGHLGGDKEYAPSEYVFAYSRALAEAAKVSGRVLFIPATDTRVFYPPENEAPRHGSCFFASKYKSIHNGKLFDITRNSTEILRDAPGEQTAEEIAALLRKSEVFYTYENTALAIEAVLCGCPAVFLPNPYLTEIIAAKELGPEGYAWGAGETDVARARAGVAQGRANYLKLYDVFWQQLRQFVTETQAHVKGRSYPKPLHIPDIAISSHVSGSVAIIITGLRVLRERGLAVFLKRVLVRTLEALNIMRKNKTR